MKSFTKNYESLLLSLVQKW